MAGTPHSIPTRITSPYSTTMLFRSCIFAFLALSSTFAAAMDEIPSPSGLMSKYSCYRCHDLEKKTVGPAFVDIESKYLGSKNARIYLAKKIRKGSRGAWGSTKMPRTPGITMDEAETIAQWILLRPRVETRILHSR